MDRLDAGEWVPLTGNGIARTPDLAQWISIAADVEPLLNGPKRFRVVYLNDHDGDTATGGADATDPIEGTELQFMVPQLNAEDNQLQDLPNIVAPQEANGTTGLRFKRNRTQSTTSLTLQWDTDPTTNDDNDEIPTGYVIDVSHDEGMTWYRLVNVDAPDDLGATTGYTHRNLTPGQLYTYRVFPEFEGRFGFPGKEEASPEEAALPARVEGLKAEAIDDQPGQSRPETDVERGDQHGRPSRQALPGADRRGRHHGQRR